MNEAVSTGAEETVERTYNRVVIRAPIQKVWAELTREDTILPFFFNSTCKTPDGLKVPVIRHAEMQSLDGLSTEIRRLSESARSNKATKSELSGSTITITSLGKLGGIVSTPVINSPEVAIIGVNRAVERPVVLNGQVQVVQGLVGAQFQFAPGATRAGQ